MSSVYHLSVCLPYDIRNPVQRVSESKGFRFINLPKILNGNIDYSHIKKLIWSRNFISENKSLLDSIVMFTDSHDVLLLSDASYIIGKFFKLDCDLLFSAEKIFSPCLSDEKPYRKEIKNFFEGVDKVGAVYPNSGCWIGYGWAALAFLDVAIAYASKQQDEDDQRVVQDVLALGYYPQNIKVKLDISQEIFISVVNNGKDLTWVGNSVFYKERSSPVPVFHANGYKKSIYFIDLYTKIFYGTSEEGFSIKSIKSNNKYISFKGGKFFLTDKFEKNSLNALIKSRKYFCIFDNDGNIFCFDKLNHVVSVGEFVVDIEERLDVDSMNDILSPYLSGGASINFESHILDNIWEFYSEKVGDCLIKYFSNL
ncbi:MAG: glycosyltransferase domain-containing protein [Gluconobacter cerinus]